jgi:VWFA-related protein
MRLLHAPLCAASLLLFIPAQEFKAQAQQPPSGVPTLRVTSTLVFLDVTVLDKSGHPVVSGLARNDFTITEDKKPQRIFSFEAPQTHVMDAAAGDDNRAGKAPVTILVLDLLNSDFADFAFIRYSVKKFLDRQPAKLPAPAELMVVGNQSLEMLQSYTRNRAELLDALNRLPAALPIKKMDSYFFWDRFQQSIDALQQIALQNKGVPGRKNVIWVGHGGPGINLYGPDFSEQDVEGLKQYVHSTANMLVDSRISLFVIYPGLKVTGREMSISGMDADADIGDDDPFSGDINFGVFANETGGKLYFDRNDIDRLIARSQLLGSEYYTLTYQPQDQDDVANGRFRRIRVTLRDRNLRVVTKAGYFAPDRNEREYPRQQAMDNLAEAAQAVIPFTALGVQVSGVVRHPDTDTAELTVQLKAKNLRWMQTDDGKDTANLILAAVSLNGDKDILASKIERVAITPVVQDPVRDAAPQEEAVASMPVTVRIPRKTKSVRVVMETETGGRIGTADVDLKTIDAAPEAPTPEPTLTVPFRRSTHRPPYVRPSSP